MYTFIVLGLIPGTNVQITFDIWLQFVTLLAVYVALSVFSMRIYRFVKLTNQLLTAPARRQLHATQLHQRAQ
ncbi:MAG: hypothetical protein ABIV43_04070 [Candidatus Saccharimonadales bacterium]